MKPEKSERLLWLQDFFSTQTVISENKNGEILIHQGEFQKVKHPLKKFDVIIPDFFHNHYLQLNSDRSFTLTKEFLRDFLSDLELELDWHAGLNFDELYKDDFLHLKNSFGPELKKVVLISRENLIAKNSLHLKVHLLKKSLEVKEGRTFGFWLNDFGMIGASPELLFDREHEELTTMALAGTRIKEKRDELLTDEKELFEHELVVQDIIEKLSLFTQDYKKSNKLLSDFKNLTHLKTELFFNLKSKINATDLLISLSPTAALGGYPFKQALEFIKKTHYHKNFPTRYYGSSLCVQDKEKTRAIVMIRGVQWDAQSFYLENGGGIVSASTLENELKEVHHKRNAIKKHYLCD